MADPSGTYTLTGVAGSPVDAVSQAGAAVTYDIVGVADIFNITAASGSSIAINQGVDAADTLNLLADSGTISLSSRQVNDIVSVTIQGDGQFITNGYFGSTSPLSSVTFGEGGGAFVVGIAGTYRAATLMQPVNGFTSANDVIDDLALQFTGFTGYSIAAPDANGSQLITVSDTSGNYSFTTTETSLAAGNYTSAIGGPLDIFRDANGGTSIAVACFLDDVLIATPQGEVPVQDISVGDIVLTRENGRDVPRAVIWTGNRSVQLDPTADRDAYPVRIRAGAFGDHRPVRDLLLTSEHCIHVEGRLIPVRMLVNGASIVIETGITRFRYHHVELERHAVLLADGLEVESYLDTGNRRVFAGRVQALHPDLHVAPARGNWAEHAAASLAVDRDTVEPLWNSLMARARSLGLAAPAPIDLVGDPDLHLVTDDGRMIAPSLRDASIYGFVVPAGASGLRLVSRASRPSDVVGPFVDDRRSLGVLVGRIGVGNRSDRTLSDLHCITDDLSGWHGVESAGARWTNGNASLPIDSLLPADQPVFIDIEVLAAGPYLADAPTDGIALAA